MADRSLKGCAGEALETGQTTNLLSEGRPVLLTNMARNGGRCYASGVDWSDLLTLSMRYCARASDSPGGGVRVSIKHLRTYTFLHTLQHYRSIALHSL